MQNYLFHNGQLLITENNTVPEDVVVANDAFEFTLGDEEKCIVSRVDSIPEGLRPVNLRDSYDKLSVRDYLRAGKAFEIQNWHSMHKYCGCCGAELKTTSPISKVCPECNKEIWPALSPAIIVLIHDKEKVLLVRSNSFRGNYYGLVAGFVELGESIEEAVVREIKEETQLEIEDLKYFGSQPWPYPQGLMLGFTAKYKSGKLSLQETELVEGGWFDINNLPEIPKPLSMARKLIDNYLENFKI